MASARTRLRVGRVAVITAAVVVGLTATLSAQSPGGSTPAGRLVVSGSLRGRLESWDWFGTEAQGKYTYPASLLRLSLAQSCQAWDWQIEFAAPVLLALPDGAGLPAPRGALGMGASYFAANDEHRNVASILPRQAFVRIKRLGGRDGQSLTLGRQEFAEGAERVPADETVAAVKRDRVAQRLLATFAFTHVGRSFDGARYTLGSAGWNVTVLGARPTRGVFDVDGWSNLDVTVLYGAMTGATGPTTRSGEWRLFFLGYRDGRETVLKADNRPLAARRADADHVRVWTYGAHYLQAVRTSSGSFDGLAWGAGQTGSWGRLSHRAGALALEGGWQPPGLPRLKPWARGGYNYGSGDTDSSDGRHGTFFQVLPTPRIYARFPFFNMMNVEDRFAELLLRPSPRTTIRGDVHALSLTSARDLWYVGGGAFDAGTFGYTGRPSGGARGLSTLVDVSIDATLTPRASITAYYGHASGRDVTDATYSSGTRAQFSYAELLVRF